MSSSKEILSLVTTHNQQKDCKPLLLKIALLLWVWDFVLLFFSSSSSYFSVFIFNEASIVWVYIWCGVVLLCCFFFIILHACRRFTAWDYIWMRNNDEYLRYLMLLKISSRADDKKKHNIVAANTTTTLNKWRRIKARTYTNTYTPSHS